MDDAPQGADPRADPARRGRLFDELTVGEQFVSPGRTVTEADIALFAGLSGDYNPLHTDEEYARRTLFRGRIAHGLLVQSISTGLANRIGVFDGTVAALQEMQICYRAPVRPGDTIRIELEVLEKQPDPGDKRGWIRYGTSILNQRGEVVVDGEWRALMLRVLPRRTTARGKESAS